MTKTAFEQYFSSERPATFSQVDLWARMNDPVWHDVSRRAYMGCLSEKERLELLCVTLAGAQPTGRGSVDRNSDQIRPAEGMNHPGSYSSK